MAKRLGVVVGFKDKTSCLKKKLNASRPSEHPPVRGKSVKTFRLDHRLQRHNQRIGCQPEKFTLHGGHFEKQDQIG